MGFELKNRRPAPCRSGFREEARSWLLTRAWSPFRDVVAQPFMHPSSDVWESSPCRN